MKFLLLSVALLSSGFLRAHEYFFAFAEINYKATEHVFEVALEGSAHDVEDVLKESGIDIGELEDHYNDSAMIQQLETFINSGLKIRASKKLHLKLLGFEVEKTGLVYFYLKSDPDSGFRSITFTFDWLMDTLPEQQNKITLTVHSQKYTCVFLPGKRTETVDLI